MKKIVFSLTIGFWLSPLLGCATSALQQGVVQNNVQVVANALSKGADPNTTDSERTPLIVLAVKQESISIVKHLIKASADVNVADQNGLTPLMWASILSNHEIVQQLINAGANVNAQDQNGWSPLMWASARGNNDIVQTLIKAGANVNVGAKELDNDGHVTSALKIASHFGYTNVVKSLIEAKVDVNFLDGQDDTALIVAIQKGNTDIVKMLISAGANTHTSAEEEYSHYNVFRTAQFYNQVAVEKLLLTEITGTIGAFRRTSLIIASMKGYDDVVKEIITRRKVDINAQDRYGETALLHASENGYANIVKMLISAGANPNDVANYGDNYGKPALMLAAEGCYIDTMKALLAGGANTEARFARDRNQTILQRTVVVGCTEGVKVLLAGGAKINAKNAQGWTALDTAYRRYPEIEKLLKASGGKFGH